MEVLNYNEFKVTQEMLASKSKRFVNYLVDRILFNLVFYAIGVIIVLIGELLGSDEMLHFLEGLDDISRIADYLITYSFYTIFYFTLESLSQKTIGKLITNTKVVLENGEKPSPETIIIRSLSRMIPFDAFSFLGAIPRGWHDTISKTYVVDSKIFDEQKQAFENYQLIGKT